MGQGFQESSYGKDELIFWVINQEMLFFPKPTLCFSNKCVPSGGYLLHMTAADPLHLWRIVLF